MKYDQALMEPIITTLAEAQRYVILASQLVHGDPARGGQPMVPLSGTDCPVEISGWFTFFGIDANRQGLLYATTVIPYRFSSAVNRFMFSRDEKVTKAVHRFCSVTSNHGFLAEEYKTLESEFYVAAPEFQEG